MEGGRVASAFFLARELVRFWNALPIPERFAPAVVLAKHYCVKT